MATRPGSRSARGRRGLALAALLLGALGCGARGPERIVLIVIDTLRRDHLSHAGGPAHTPHIDALAARGVSIPDAVASFHATTMSMGALFTGRSPSLESGDPAHSLGWAPRNWCGLARYAAAEPTRRCVPAQLTTLGEVMRDRGYTPIGIPSNALLFRPYGFDRGFAVWAQVGETAPLKALRRPPSELAALRAHEAVVAAALAALDARPDDRFFLYVHFMDAHDWNLAPGRTYAQGVEQADDGVGALLAGLEQRGLLEGAAVVLTADHGEALDEDHLLPTTPRHTGAPSFEAVLRVPLVIAGTPVRPPPGMVRTADLFALLARIAGAAAGSDDTFRPEEILISERYYQTYRQGRFKSFVRRDDGAYHLVDLEADPGERVDVAGAHPEVVAAHRARLAELSRLLAGEEAPAELDATDEHRLRALGYIE